MGKSIEQRVSELEKQNKEMAKQLKILQGKTAIKISKKLGVGDTFELSGLNWKILDITEKGYKCLAERLPNNMQFGSNNDWKDSKIRSYLNGEFYEKLAAEIGAENIIPFERNLLSLDGQTEYGTCEDKVSILSLDEYRQHRVVIPNEEYWWWTLTPDSTKCNKDTTWLHVVCPSGCIGNCGCDFSIGVRPFCIFSSSIFASEE